MATSALGERLRVRRKPPVIPPFPAATIPQSKIKDFCQPSLHKEAFLEIRDIQLIGRFCFLGKAFQIV